MSAKSVAGRGAFRDIPYMGVIHVVAEAMKLGFRNGDPEWSNLGQGQPEVGPMRGAPERIMSFAIEPSDLAYGHINGIDPLRQAIADHYNRLYRQRRDSKYKIENISIGCGGRIMLARVFASFGAINLGYQIPDYTAYQDQLEYHQNRFTPVLVLTTEGEGFKLSPARLSQAITEHGLGAFILSNPCNPTGRVIQGEELSEWLDIARETGCFLALDEFYSHFIYGADGAPGAGPVSAAAYVEDVNKDPVICVDGLTKSFRYPGWRVGWAVGPADMIDALGRAASAIDGGPSNPIQRAAIRVLEPAHADQETTALRQVFARKRNLMLDELAGMGIRCPIDCEGTFYVWANLDNLPAPFNDSDVFFREALKRKVLTVPGPHFDVNPGGRRRGGSLYRSWMRFSFGPPEDNVRAGLMRLKGMLSEA